MLERTIDLLEIQARIEDCASYNFGMRNADQLAHVDAPDLLIALGLAEAQRDEARADAANMRELAELEASRCPCSYVEGSPRQECPQHGDISWFAAGLSIVQAECGRLERDNAELIKAMTELQPDPVLVEGSFIPVAEWPMILGNFMRTSAECARAAKAAHVEAMDLKAERDGLLATIEAVREIASKRVRDPQLGFGGPPDDMPLEGDYVNFGEFYVAEEIRAALTTSPTQSLAAHDAEVAASALEDVAHSIQGCYYEHELSIRERAAEYRKTEPEGN